MKERSFDEMIAYFNRRVSEMDIAQGYKIELLGMVTALGYKHEKTAQPEIIRCKECKHSFLHDNGEKISRICGRTKMCGTTKDDWFCADAERRTDGVDS